MQESPATDEPNPFITTEYTETFYVASETFVLRLFWLRQAKLSAYHKKSPLCALCSLRKSGDVRFLSVMPINRIDILIFATSQIAHLRFFYPKYPNQELSNQQPVGERRAS